MKTWENVPLIIYALLMKSGQMSELWNFMANFTRVQKWNNFPRP